MMTIQLCQLAVVSIGSHSDTYSNLHLISTIIVYLFIENSIDFCIECGYIILSLKLKQMKEKMTKNELVTKCWTKLVSKKYTSEASTLTANDIRNICPHCFENFSKKHLINVVRWGSINNEITGWEFQHSVPNCYAILAVFND